MLSLTKRQLKSLIDFCPNLKLMSGIYFYGNEIVANNGRVAIRVILKLDGFKEEKVIIPREALLAAIGCMDKDDFAQITAESISINNIVISFNEVQNPLFGDDVLRVFESYKDGVPSKFLMFVTTSQNKLQEALLAFGVKEEIRYGTKERNFYMSGDGELYHAEVVMAGIDPTEKKEDK